MRTEMEAARASNSAKMYTESQLIQAFGIERKKQGFLTLYWSTIKNRCRFSGICCRQALERHVPVVDWLPKYALRDNLLRDVLAGITVGVVHLPQGLAYALLASLPPITGLYVSFFPVLVYMILGTSRHMSIGTFAVVSLMIAQVIDDNVPACSPQTLASIDALTTMDPELLNATTTSSISCEAAQDTRKIQIAVALAVVNGIIQILMFLLQLGVVTTYLSTTLVSGFTCGAAFHVLTSQVPKLLGVEVARHSGSFALIYVYIDIFKTITTVNWATFIISVTCILFIFFGKMINLKLKDRLPVPIPWELGVVIFATLISYLCQLQSQYKVATVGHIPTGIKTSVPLAADVGSIFLQAFPIAIVAFATEISLSQMFATKHSYNINPDQELLAMGFCNIIGCFFQCFPAAPSLSRSVICDEAGAKTQLSGLFSSLFILTILLWIGPLFESLPQAALASIIVVNLKNLLKQFEKIPQLWKVSRTDAAVWIVTWSAVVLLGVSVGLAVAVLFQIFSVVVRIQRSNASVLGLVGDSKSFRNVNRFRTSKSKDSGMSHIVILQFPVPLIYVNRERFYRQVTSTLGFDPKLAKGQSNGTASRVAEALGTEVVAQIDVRRDEEIRVQSRRTLESEDDGISLSQALTGDENGSNISRGVNRESVKYFILDLCYCSFLDYDGADALQQLYKSLDRLGVHLFLTRCNDNVFRALRVYSEDQLPPCFLDISKAVEATTKGTTFYCKTGENDETQV